jgi:hypothetical protein
MMGRKSVDLGLKCGGGKFPMFLPVLERRSRPPGPPLRYPVRRAVLLFPGFTPKFLVHVLRTEYSFSFEPVTQDLSCVAQNQVSKLSTTLAFCGLRGLRVLPAAEPAKLSIISRGCQAA